MASVLIHMAVAKKINEKIKYNEKDLLLGVIAPDIGKDINIPRKISHFTDGISSTPNIDLFLKKYKAKLNNSYEMGYFIHLLTDVVWFDEFIKNYEKESNFVLKDGGKVYLDEEEFNDLIYNDYTNLNRQLLDYYNMDLSIFYEEYEFPDVFIEEIPKDKLRQLVDKMGIICSKDYTNTEYVFSIENIVHFVEFTTLYVWDNIKEYIK